MNSLPETLPEGCTRKMTMHMSVQGGGVASYSIHLPTGEALPIHYQYDSRKKGVEFIAVFRSRDFLVQIFPATESIVRMSVNRTELRQDGRWSDEISWDELQRLKAEAGYGDLDAIEIYPPDKDVVNVANMRHLWILPDDLKLPFAWRAE